MRGHLLLLAGSALAACAANTTGSSTAAGSIHYPLPARAAPSPSSPAASIKAGTPERLAARQQDAVRASVATWLKHPASARFGEMAAARKSNGAVTVCGYVNGKNARGIYGGIAPFIGVLHGTPAKPDFVVVEIGSTVKDRAVVASLCRESGIPEIG